MLEVYAAHANEEPVGSFTDLTELHRMLNPAQLELIGLRGAIG